MKEREFRFSYLSETEHQIILEGQGFFLVSPFISSNENDDWNILGPAELSNRLNRPRSIASRENGQLPPIIIVFSFIAGINRDNKDPWIPTTFHLNQFQENSNYTLFKIFSCTKKIEFRKNCYLIISFLN